jgi:hypothetical protein
MAFADAWQIMLPSSPMVGLSNRPDRNGPEHPAQSATHDFLAKVLKY